jgi:hypothetical protein
MKEMKVGMSSAEAFSSPWSTSVVSDVDVAEIRSCNSADSS